MSATQRPVPGLPCTREVMWRRVLDDLSVEHARFERNESGCVISGAVMIAEQGAPLRVDYRIACDEDWRTRTVEVHTAWQGARRILRLERDPGGRWRRDGEPSPELDGCSDVDLEVTPATNALPVNRLRLAVGGRQEILAAWARFPSLRVIPARQAYERLAETRYRYTSLESGFTAAVDVDADGIPTAYEGIWRRIAESS
ncbi:MAG TPA: putative glycolipid-binding domain-containing protein [bacterium]|nr:putative glycolipid-binding domain-containing protein [bacterium]